MISLLYFRKGSLARYTHHSLTFCPIFPLFVELRDFFRWLCDVWQPWMGNSAGIKKREGKGHIGLPLLTVSEPRKSRANNKNNKGSLDFWGSAFFVPLKSTKKK